RQRLAHADGLAALARKTECEAHLVLWWGWGSGSALLDARSYGARRLPRKPLGPIEPASIGTAVPLANCIGPGGDRPARGGGAIGNGAPFAPLPPRSAGRV